MKVYILRGLPGSGKSTWAQEQQHHVGRAFSVICSADDYHMKNGIYQFDPKNISTAHNECMKKFLHSLNNVGHTELLIVDNTNTTTWEIAPYYRLAEVYGHKPIILEFLCDPIQAFKQTIHGVPYATITRMFRNIQEGLPQHWNVQYYSSYHGRILE